MFDGTDDYVSVSSPTGLSKYKYHRNVGKVKSISNKYFIDQGGNNNWLELNPAGTVRECLIRLVIVIQKLPLPQDNGITSLELLMERLTNYILMVF